MAKLAPPQVKAKAAQAKARASPILQPKLEVSPARDRYEAEADRIADRIVSSSAGPTSAPPSITSLTAGGLRRKPVVAAPPPKTAVRTMKVEDEDSNKETQVQRSADGQSHAPPSTESSIARMRAGGGSPLSKDVRAPMEAGMGRSLSGVRIHNSQPAHNAARSVGARAFTVGNDVFFGAGRYQPNTRSGQHLLAHELVHTQQQKGLGHGAQRMPLQRVDEPTGDDPVAEEIEEAPREWRPPRARNRKIEFTDEARQTGKITLPVIQIPRIQGGTKGTQDHSKGPGKPGAGFNEIAAPFVYKGKNPSSESAGQRFVRQKYFQDAETKEPIFRELLPDSVPNWSDGGGILDPDGTERYYLRRQNESLQNTRSIIIGTLDELADHKLIKKPDWDRNGVHRNFDVDHAQESQLGGADEWDNFWLLGSEFNQTAGRLINTNISGQIQGIIDQATEGDFFTRENAGKAPSFEGIKERSQTNWVVEFTRIRGLQVSGRRDYWSRAEILSGEHLKLLRALTRDQAASEGLIADGSKPDHVSVFATPNGGYRQRFTIQTDGSAQPDNRTRGFFQGFDLISADVTEDPNNLPYIKKLNGYFFRRRRRTPLNPTFAVGDNGIRVTEATGLGFSGVLDQADLNAKISALPTTADGMSPVTYENVGINGEGIIFATGHITATKALFPNLEVPIHIYGNDIFVEFPIPTDALSFGPVTVTDAALQIGVGEDGFFLQGTAGVAVDSVGSGRLTARVDGATTKIEGDFNFDVDFLDPASAGFVYDFGADTLTFTLNAGVKEGTLPGVDRGTVTATFTRDSIAISGTLFLGGMLSGTEVSVSYAPETGLSLGADNIPLPVEAIPGISSATASLHASRDPRTGEWAFGGGGQAVLDIAGVTGTIGVQVDGDRVMIIGGPLTVTKGPASGTLNFTATNAPIDDDGNPVEGEVTDTYTIWGRGTAEITFGDVLQGSAAITLSPDANIRIEGTIGLPPTFEVFPIQRFDRDLLHVETPDFPIWGVSVGGIGFGIFAFADADLSFNSFVGPGRLVDTQVTASMDLDAPEDATVTGSARFVVPAGAGLALDIGGGLRARAAVAFVEGRVGLDGELGIEAEASAGVDVAWNRTDGLSVDAEIAASARPKFRIGVNARVRAGVDLGITDVTKTWGPWNRTLGEFGPDMEMGVTIPARWSETDGVDFSLDDIEVRQPQINARDILKSAFEELV